MSQGALDATQVKPWDRFMSQRQEQIRPKSASLGRLTPSVSTRDEGALLKMALGLRDVIRAAAAC